MACNFVSDAIVYISGRQLCYLNQYISKPHLKYSSVPYNFLHLQFFLLQELNK